MIKVQQPIKHSDSLFSKSIWSLLVISWDLQFMTFIFMGKQWLLSFFLTNDSGSRSAFEFFWVSIKNYYGVFPSWYHTTIIYLLWNSTIYIPLNLFSALLNFNWCAMYISFNKKANDRYYWIMLNHGWLCYMSKGCICIWTGDRSSAGSQNNKRKTARYQRHDLQQAQRCYIHSSHFLFPRTITIYLFYIE